MARARWGAATAAGVAVFILCGCGASITSDQVQQTRDTLLSDARESVLLAEAVAAGSMIGSSASTHAQLLADDVKMQADTLSQGTPPADQRDRVQRLLADSGAVASVLDKLEQSSNPTAAAALRAQLQRLGDDIART